MIELDAVHWRKAAFPTPEQFQKELTTLYLQAAPHYDNRTPPPELLATLIKAATEIYEVEFPLEYSPHHQAKLKNPHATYKLCLELFVLSLVGFTKNFPHEYRTMIGEKTKPLFTIGIAPAVDTLPAIQALLNPFKGVHAKLSDVGLFQGRHAPYAWHSTDAPKEPTFDDTEPIYGDQYARRQWHSDKRQFDEGEHKRWKQYKKKFDAEHKEVHRDFGEWRLPFVDTPWFDQEYELLRTVQVPFEIPAELRFQGQWICGTQGSGKSTLLKTIFLDDLKEVWRGKASIVIMDSSGEFLDYASHLKIFAKGQPLENRLVVLTPDEKHPLGLNPLDIGTTSAHSIDLLEYVFSSLQDAKTTALQSTLFRSIFMALQAIPGASLRTFRSFLTDGWKQYEKEIRTLHAEDRDFFLNGEFDIKDYRDTKTQLLWRLRDLTTRVPLLREMFNSPKTLINIGELMNQGKVICIDNRRDLLSDTGSEFFARFFLALIRAAADQRSKLSEHQKMPTYIYIDECQNVIENDENVEKIIAECRKQKIGLILAHQFWSQITNEKVKSALSNCAIRFVNADDDAAQLAPRMRTKPDKLHLPRGSFAAFVRTKTESAVTINVTLTPPMETMTAGEFSAIQQEMRARYCYGVVSTASGNYDLEWTITISPRMAEEGVTKQINDFNVTIPPGTKNGTRFRLKGKGGPKPDGTFGDIYLTVNAPQRPNQQAIGSGDSNLNEWG